ncbi:MAG: sugar phosphate isomerase/epimerase [Acidobacteria bacterium]|nr:sugar phosphate isomerase/epimerase [Acidobacteriota bacterium]
MRRRSFLATAATAAAQPPAASKGVRFGIDLFSIRSQGWTPFEYLDYCAKFKARVVHFSEIRFMGSLEEAHLKKVRAHAAKLGVEIEIGMRSICPSSKAFDPAQGTAEEQLTRMIAAAVTVGSPIVRTFLGTMADRTGPVSIEAHIENTAKVLRNVRARVVDAGLKVAIENHAGDMQGRELKMLIEEAGKDFVGACLDSGNPLWTIEDPHLTLETLAPYVITSHVRDTAVWKDAGRIGVAWTRMGEGNIGIREYTRKFQELCPGRPFSLEIIVTQPRWFAYQDPKFWDAYRKTPAWEFARFLALAEKGAPYQGLPPAPKEQAAQREREDLEASIRFAHEELGV